jgi:hypothetical protein
MVIKEYCKPGMSLAAITVMYKVSGYNPEDRRTPDSPRNREPHLSHCVQRRQSLDSGARTTLPAKDRRI